MTMMTSYDNSHIMIFSYNPSIQRMRVRTQVISSRFSSFSWSDWDLHYHDISWLQPDHAAQIYNSAIVLFGWNNSCSCRWTTMNWNQLCASVPRRHLPNTIIKSVPWIRSWDLNILRWSNLSRYERFARIGQFHHFDHFGAKVLLLWCLKKSRAWQRLMNSYYIFCKSIFAQNYLKLG